MFVHMIDLWSHKTHLLELACMNDLTSWREEERGVHGESAEVTSKYRELHCHLRNRVTLS